MKAMTTEQFERAHVLITKINQHKNNMEDIQDYIKSMKAISRDLTIGCDVTSIKTSEGSKDFFVDTIIGKIPSEVVKSVLLTIIKHHLTEITRLEAELDKI